MDASHLLLEGQRLLQESRGAEAEPLLLRALDVYERQGSVPDEFIQVLTDLASLAITRDDLVAGESYLRRALELANARLGAHHPDVSAILGGLARLYLRRNEFTQAEPLLRQLLDIKGARGEEHPEFATVLASLATVESARGAHESAERMLRRVLAIREKTLAPNHFATVTTLEHLADSCAAGGKFDEALGLLHRALAHRQRALGFAHPSIGAARERIADLELLSSNEELGSMPMLTPTMGTPPVIDAPLEEPVESDPPSPDETADIGDSPFRGVRDLYDEWEDEDEFDERWRKRRLVDRLDAKLVAVTAFARTPRGRLTVLAVGVASLLTAVVVAAQMRGVISVPPAGALLVATQGVAPARLRAEPNVAVERDVIAQPASAPASDRHPRSADVERLEPDAPSRFAPPEPAAPAEPVQPADTVTPDAEPIALPNAPQLRRLDALVGRPPVARPRAPLVAPADFTPMRTTPTERAVGGGPADHARGHTVHAILPAGNPVPEYPPDLLGRGIEGRVVAEFLVDAKGRVDTRTLRILSSTDERFSQAVRAVLPNLRFLPAESDGVKTEEWVAMPFRFAARRR